MDVTQRVRLYRTLIMTGIVLAIVAVAYALSAGMFLLNALWVVVAYGALAWILYRIIVAVWGPGEDVSGP